MQRNSNPYYQSQGQAPRPRATSDQAHRPPFLITRTRQQAPASNMEYSRSYGSYDSASQNAMGRMGGLQSAGQDMMSDRNYDPRLSYNVPNPALLSPVDMARNPSQHGSGSMPGYATSPYGSSFPPPQLDIEPGPGFIGVPDQDAGAEYSTQRDGENFIIGRNLSPNSAQPYRDIYQGSESTHSYRQFSDAGGYPTTPISEPDTGNDGYHSANDFAPSLGGMDIIDSTMTPTSPFGMQAGPSEPYASNMTGARNAPMARQASSSKTGKKTQHWCTLADCSHRRPFGTRNDLDRHKFSVHKIPAEGQKVYVCQGASCLAAGRFREWPRKDNFKSHCKVAHPDEELDDLVLRSERISRQNIVATSDQGPEYEDGEHPEPRPSKSLRLSIPNSNPQPDSPPITLVPPNDDSSPGRVHEPQDPTYLSPTTATSASGERRYKQTQPIYKRRKREADGHDLQAVSPHTSPIYDSALEALNNLSPEQAASVIAHVRHSHRLPLTQTESSSTNACGKCNKTFPRPCDLKKHEYRHTRPWGCTNDTCAKRFGSKNDWKRHEHMLHVQEELWVCGIMPCLFTTESGPEFREHLQVSHRMVNRDELDQTVKERRLGRRWARTVWCGFCRDVIALKKRNLKSWEERFDHIDYHFMEEGRSIDDWYPPGQSLPKKKLLELEPPETPNAPDVDEENEGDSDDSDVVDTVQPRYMEQIPVDPRLLRAAPPAVNSELEECQPGPGRQFGADRQVRCCRCQNGTMYVYIQSTCPNCSHDSHDCRSCEQLRPHTHDIFPGEQLRARHAMPLSGPSSIDPRHFAINSEVDVEFNHFLE